MFYLREKYDYFKNIEIMKNKMIMKKNNHYKWKQEKYTNFSSI